MQWLNRPVTPSKKQKWPKMIFLGILSKKNPVSGRAMVKGKMLHFVAFFVHFDKSIRPHPGPLWGGGCWSQKHKLSQTGGAAHLFGISSHTDTCSLRDFDQMMSFLYELAGVKCA